MIYVFAQPWVFESAFCKSVHACVCWPMKYERIKFYYIVWAILGFGLKHTHTHTHTEKRKDSKQAESSKSNNNTFHKQKPSSHTHTREVQPICLKSTMATFQLPLPGLPTHRLFPLFPIRNFQRETLNCGWWE